MSLLKSSSDDWEDAATVRILCVLLAAVVGLQVANYHSLALFIARTILGTTEDTGFGLLPYGFYFLLPAAAVFWAAGTVALIRASHKKPSRVWSVVAMIGIVDMLLLVLSVAVYYRRIRG